ncbi:MAG: hypothetical protein H7X76_09975 [Prolixibacteraceae bacterium]|nr:hypothetical protein [Burkholderiales bacterium]
MKKILFAVALASMVATNAQAGGRGGYGYGYGHYHGGASYFWWGAALGAALTIPFYYSRAWADPGPYYYSPYYGPGPIVYANPPVYVQRQPVYVQSQPNYAVAASEPRVVTPPPANGPINMGPANPLPPVNSNASEPPSSNANQEGSDRWFVYPSKGQSQQQAANDRYECNRWATNESGYDPDLRTHRNPETGPVYYGRALSACLEGRGYAVR